MKRSSFYKVKIVQQEKPLSYNAVPAEIILGPIKTNRIFIIGYCKHLQKYLGEQVKVEFERIKITIKK